MNLIVPHSIASLLAILLAVVFYINSLKLPPAAYQLPRILCGIIVFLSILMWYGAILEERALKKKEDVKTSEEKEDTGFIDYKRAFIFALLIALYIYLMRPIGYFIVTPLFIITTYLYIRSTNLVNTLLISIAFTVFVYLAFVYFLKVPLPLGILEGFR